MGVTAFLLVVDGDEVVVRVPSDDSSEGLGESQGAARAAPVALRDQLRTKGVTDGGPYEPATISVLVQPVERDPDAETIGLLVADWPLGDLTESRGPDEDAWWCEVVAGADVAALDARHVGGLVWRSGGELYRLTFRPDLPDRMPCEW